MDLLWKQVKTFDKNTEAFFVMVRAGLFPVHCEGVMVNASFPEDVDWSEVYRLAEEQSVVGLIAAGLERVTDIKVPQEWVLQFVGQTLQIEQRNKAMNDFVARLIQSLRARDVYTLLVKGQGIAQCYAKPMWRASGDVDLLLSKDNYQKAKTALLPVATNVEEDTRIQHLEMTIEKWPVELHGTLRGGLWRQLDKVIDSCQYAVFYEGNVRSWVNGHTQVFLPRADEDVVLVFAHILQHFFKGGIGLRQICDWCRLLWTYRDTLNHKLLETRIRKAGIMTEWKAFYNLASRYLGMLDEFQVLGTMFQVDSRFDKKADRVMEFVMETGNFGHNRDESYKQKQTLFVRLVISFWRRAKDSYKQFRIFPLDALKAWWAIVRMGVRFMVQG